MNREGKKCLLYSRVSTEMQVDGYSLEAQKNCLKRFAEREEMMVVDAYEDAGKSGKSIEGRPAFKRMLSDIENGKNVDYVLVYKLSRFGRNAADILNSLALLQTYDVNLICIEEGIDSSQTSGKLLISVLSAVAEIERENILEQTMNGRREKARQGKWNGGPAPYGYTINDGVLQIDEEEAKIVRTIYEMFINTKIGYTGIAKYLNLQGITKRPRKESDAKVFSGHFIQILLDNPVYCGKIAYGRRKHERVKGKKNEYRVVCQKEFSLTDGLHEGIVSEELWEKARNKRVATALKLASKIGKDRTYLLTGILKCPKCGSPMYANRIRWTKKDGTEKEVMYYSCSRNKMKRGGFCDYSANLKKTDIEPLVIGVIKQIINDVRFVEGVKSSIGIHVDADKIVEEIKNYEAKLKEVQLNKNRLETELDTLPIDAKYRDRKIKDMTTRIDSMYDVIVEIEEMIDDARYRKQAIEEKSLTFENIYRILEHFSKIYDIINDEDRKELLSELIKEIHIYPEGESDYPLKSIKFAFPILLDGNEVDEIFLNKPSSVETLSDQNTINIIVNNLLALQEKQSSGTQLLSMLTKEKRQTENSIKNIMTAIEKGVITNTTTRRLKELEEQQENLERQILIEKSKTAIKYSEQEIRAFYEQALKLEPKMLIEYIVKEILVYDDKIEIIYTNPIMNSPDDESRQGFSIYYKTVEIQVIKSMTITIKI